MTSLLRLLICLALMVQANIITAATPWKDGTPRTAIADLFEWNWNSIAKECVNFLGPKGYKAVKISPPNEHINGREWWVRYQPVSYQIQSYSGTREEFRNMVNACTNAGVDVYVDTVINHMANGSGTGSAGSSYSRDWLSYPSVPYGNEDFHTYCPIANSATECWLSDLPDLNTSKTNVQNTIINYLKDLRSLGVSGFYIDAAKHIQAGEMKAILDKVPGPFFVGQEIWQDAQMPAFLVARSSLGTITEFEFYKNIKQSFVEPSTKNVSNLSNFYSQNVNIPSESALVFVTNHDLERSACTSSNLGALCRSLTVLLPHLFYPANVMMLAHPYGIPLVYSSYYFNGTNDGPGAQPYNGNELVPSNCSATVEFGKWNCSHRDWRVANMVGFRNYTDGSPIQNWLPDTNVNRVSFQRGNKGFVAINNTSSYWQKTFTTGLPDGVYCNVVASANPENGECPTDTQVSVNGGLGAISIPPRSTAALHIGARVICDNPSDFNFSALADVAVSSLQISNTVTITGLGCAAPISITGGEYSINGGVFTNAPGMISNGQTLQLRTTAPVTAGTTGSATVKVGTDNISFSVTTASPNRCGNANTCTNPMQPIAGNSVTVFYKGLLQNSTSLKLHWGINGWTGTQDSIMQKNADGYWSITLALPNQTAELDFVVTNGSLWDNNGGADWRIPVSSKILCDNPADFSFTPATNVALNSIQTSNTVTISGLSCAANISIIGGEYSLNGAAYTSIPGTINNGQTLRLRQTAPSTENTTSTATVKVGVDTISFSVSTLSSSRCSNAITCSQPLQPQAGKPVTIYYKGALLNSPNIKIHWGINGWTNTQQTSMQQEGDGYWSATLPLPSNANELNFVFTNGNQWDNNNSANWKMNVVPCTENCGPVSVSFKVNASTSWGESVYMTGNTAELGNNSFNSNDLPKCDASNYPIWTCSISFASGNKAIEYRYVKLGISTKPESGPIRTLTIPSTGGLNKDDGNFRL